MAGSHPDACKIVAQLRPATRRRACPGQSGGLQRDAYSRTLAASGGRAVLSSWRVAAEGAGAGAIGAVDVRTGFGFSRIGACRARICPARRPQVSGRFQAIRLRQPRCPPGRHADAGQPRPTHELRQIQSVHAQGHRGARLERADVRVAADQQRGRNRQRLWPAGR
ncbi:hypothetical protein D3C86_1346600 [compost metagenome]